jgi:FixJ family two-component response regulator
MFDSPLATPETILVVNDDTKALADVSLIFRNGGLTVLSSASPEAALKISQEYVGTIDLLVIAVQMPGMSGPDLAERLIEQREALRVSLLDGYGDGEVLLLNYNWKITKRRSVAHVLRENVKEIVHSR